MYYLEVNGQIKRGVWYVDNPFILKSSTLWDITQRHLVKVNVSEEHNHSILRLEEYAKQETGCEVNDRNKWTYNM
jgi:hypothetical protein